MKYKNLKNIKIVPREKKIGRSCVARKVISCTIDNEPIILKYHGNKKQYGNEKNIYILLQNETFLPILKYFDDENYILCLTDCGDILQHRVSMDPKFSLKDYDTQLTTIIDIMSNKYGIFHNDLRPQNICIDNNNNIKLIDFDATSNVMKEEKYIFRTTKHKFRTVYR